MSNFLPKENSRASLLLDYVYENMTEAGDLITYEELADLINVDLSELSERERGSLFAGVIGTANKRLHRNGDWRHLINVETVGYRIATPAENREEHISRLRRAMRESVAALRVTEKAVRHPDATPGERIRATNAAAAQSALLSAMRKGQRKSRLAWPTEESSPVLDDTSEAS